MSYWNAAANGYRRWRASPSNSKDVLRTMIDAEFKQRQLGNSKKY
jgi:hypothetical protein